MRHPHIRPRASLLALAGLMALATGGLPREVAAQVIIDQSVLDRLGPPRREAPPAPAGPGMGGLQLAPGEAAREPPAVTRRPPPRRTTQQRRPPRPRPTPAVQPAPRIGPEEAAPATPAPAAPAPPPPVAAARPAPPPPAPLPLPPERPAPPAPAPPAPAPPAPAPPAPAPPPAPPTPRAGPTAPAAPPPVVAAPPVAASPVVPPAVVPPAVTVPPAPRTATAGAAAGTVAAATGSGALSLAFAAGDASLAAPARARLEAFARALPPDEAGARILVAGYGADDGGDASRARRLALARAIEVRSVLLAQGVRSTRIDVRALGTPTDGSAPDRVDVTLGPPAPQAATALPASPNQAGTPPR